MLPTTGRSQVKTASCGNEKVKENKKKRNFGIILIDGIKSNVVQCIYKSISVRWNNKFKQQEQQQQ